MTVETNDTVERYTISGVGPYVFSFRVFDEDEIAVTAISGAGVATALAITTDYTVAGVDDEDGGTITLVAGTATTYAGYTLDVRSNTAEYQPTSIRNQGRFLPEIHEDAFDRLSRQIQDLSRKTRASLRYPDDEITDAVAPAVASRKGRYLFSNAVTGAWEWVTSIATTALNQTIFNQYQVDSDPFKRSPSEIAASVTPIDFSKLPGPIIDVERHGAVGDGVTDDTAAIRRAQSVLDAAGSGTLMFGLGKTYLLSTVSTYSVVVPVAGANFTPATESHQYHVLIANKGNFCWDLNGSKLKSSITNGGEMFILDGVRNFEVMNGEIESVTAKNGSGGVTTAGMTGFGITSQTRDSYNIKFKNLKATNVYVPVYAFGDAASGFRVYGISIENLRHDGGIYTLAFHNNGDDVTALSVQSVNCLREYFIYGVANHDVQIYSVSGVAGFGGLIKAYDRDTTQIKLKLRTLKSISSANVTLQSQHAPAVQATPKRLIGIDLDISNSGTAGLGPAVAFEYYRDAVLTATSSNNLWTGIKLRGIHEQAPTVSTTQNTLGAAGTLNTDELVLLNGSLVSIYSRTGLIDSKQFYSTFTPNLRIANVTTGITYAVTSAGEYWRDGRFIEFMARVVLTSKGVQAGALTFDLPVQSSTTNANNALVRGFAIANMAGLTSEIVGYVSLAGTTLTLQDQSATASANLDNTNLTDTSEFFLHVRYPI